MPATHAHLLSEPIRSCLGLDIAKAKLDACLLHAERTQHAQFENSAKGLAALRAWCKKHGALIPRTVLEATGRYSELAASTLHAAGHPVHLANPRRIKDHGRSLGYRNKTDRIDAALIVSFGVSPRPLPLWLPPSAAQQRLRDLLRRLSDLETMRQAERNRTETLADPLLVKSLARILRAFEKEIATLETQIAAHLQATPELRAAAAWLGVTPRVRQSGSSLHRTAAPGPEGNRHLRRVLFMAAMVARRHNPRLKTFADRLAAKGKAKLSILIAVLHKLLKISFAILHSHSTYNPLHNAKN